jgi:hypothetical protein
VTLRVVGGNEKTKTKLNSVVLVRKRTIPTKGNEKGSLKSETVKCGHESQGTRTRERLRWRGPATYTKDRSVLSSEWMPHKNKTAIVKE